MTAIYEIQGFIAKTLVISKEGTEKWQIKKWWKQ